MLLAAAAAVVIVDDAGTWSEPAKRVRCLRLTIEHSAHFVDFDIARNDVRY